MQYRPLLLHRRQRPPAHRAQLRPPSKKLSAGRSGAELSLSKRQRRPRGCIRSQSAYWLSLINDPHVERYTFEPPQGLRRALPDEALEQFDQETLRRKLASGCELWAIRLPEGVSSLASVLPSGVQLLTPGPDSPSLTLSSSSGTWAMSSWPDQRLRAKSRRSWAPSRARRQSMKCMRSARTQRTLRPSARAN